jgi:hypothetical protein
MWLFFSVLGSLSLECYRRSGPNVEPHRFLEITRPSGPWPTNRSIGAAVFTPTRRRRPTRSTAEAPTNAGIPLCSLITFLITYLSARSKRRKRLRARDLYIISSTNQKFQHYQRCYGALRKLVPVFGTARLERVEEYVAVGWLSTHTEPQPPWPAREEKLERSRRSTLQGRKSSSRRTDKIQQGGLCRVALSVETHD